MAILIENIDDISVVIVDSDRATIVEANYFKEKVTFEINKGSKKFIIDLKTCDFIDSTFLAAIVTLYKRILGNGGQFKIVGFKKPVRAMFELTQLAKIFDIYEDEQHALMSFE